MISLISWNFSDKKASSLRFQKKATKKSSLFKPELRTGIKIWSLSSAPPGRGLAMETTRATERGDELHDMDPKFRSITTDYTTQIQGSFGC